MPSYGASFEQLEAYFSEIDSASPANSAQSNWTAGAAEARQLAAELRKNLDELLHYWSGPAATEYTKAMNAIIEYAEGLSDDMTEMGAGLSAMAGSAASIQPQAISIINSSRSNHYTRAAAIAPLNALLNQLGSSYQSNRSAHWREPKEPPQQLPKAGGEADSNPQQVEVPGDVRPSPILGDIADIGQYLNLASSAYEAFDAEEFPSGVTGEFPVGDIPSYDGPGGGTAPGGGPMPSPDDPDYQPLPEPEPELTESPVHLAGAGPTGLSAGTPAVSLGATGGASMGAPGGPMPMGMGMGAAGAASGSARPSAAPSKSGAGGAGLFGPAMGAGRRGEAQPDDEGVRTWLTEDELTFDADAAPSGVVGRSR
ncbi:MAG: WXG100 family type VII secretion target [Stackebrandtia sp.]